MPFERLDLIALAQTTAGDLADLPWGAHAAAGAGLLVGVALLLSGRKLLRLGIVLAAAVLGGATAFYGAPTLGLAVDPNIMLAVGLALGAILGGALYRLTISITFMALLAVLGPLIAAGSMRLAAAVDLPEPPPPSEAPAALESGPPESFEEAADEAWRRVRAFVQETARTAEAEWNQLERDEKSVLLGSAMLGAAAGLVIGWIWPKRTAAIMSAGLGAALTLPSAAWLLEAYLPAAAAKLPTEALTWLILWAGLSVVGAVAQWTRGRRKTDS